MLPQHSLVSKALRSRGLECWILSAGIHLLPMFLLVQPHEVALSWKPLSPLSLILKHQSEKHRKQINIYPLIYLHCTRKLANVASMNLWHVNYFFFSQCDTLSLTEFVFTSVRCPPPTVKSSWATSGRGLQRKRRSFCGYVVENNG